jgi:putative ATPase
VSSRRSLDASDDAQLGLHASARRAPLAERMRPRSLDDFAGQRDLLGPGRPVRELVERGHLDSMVLWGPPGVGKTTLARILASRVCAAFVSFSAVTDGVARVREIVDTARERKRRAVETVLFVDEIHRFNRAQQDALLPHVEQGTVTLIGATTENPSFALTSALLSRVRVLVLQPLGLEELRVIVRRALGDSDHGLGGRTLSIDDDALTRLAALADGDARRALGILEAAAALATNGAELDARGIEHAAQHRAPTHDRTGDRHYDIISALHKSVRGSDVQAALYWLARMIVGGDDPRYVARRLVRMASEDIGLADPNALAHALHAAEAFERLGSPEGELALAQAVVYLASAPKSNRLYEALASARSAASRVPAPEVPLHLRNAPTALMAELGHGAGYHYPPDADAAAFAQTYLPDTIADATFYTPTAVGYEQQIAKRLAWWAERRANAQTAADDGGAAEGAAAKGAAAKGAAAERSAGL